MTDECLNPTTFKLTSWVIDRAPFSAEVMGLNDLWKWRVFLPDQQLAEGEASSQAAARFAANAAIDRYLQHWLGKAPRGRGRSALI